MANKIGVKLDRDKAGKITCHITLELGLRADFTNGYFESAGRRKVSRRFTDLACKMLVKQIRPQLDEALKNEHRFFNLPPEEKAKVHAASFGQKGKTEDEGDPLADTIEGEAGFFSSDDARVFTSGGESDPPVPQADQEPDHGD